MAKRTQPTPEPNAAHMATEFLAGVIAMQQSAVEVTFSTGVVLELRDVPRLMLQRVCEKFPDPPIPVVTVPGTDGEPDWTEENPDDPAFLEAMDKVSTDRIKAVMAILKCLGTTPKLIPEGMHPPESDAWLEQVEYFGLDVRRDQFGRYEDWLDYYAAPSLKDQSDLSAMTFQRYGLMEVEVHRALDWFRRRKTRGAVEQLSASATGSDRDNGANRAARRRARTG